MKINKLLTIVIVIFTLLPFLSFSQNEKENFISLRQENSLRISAPDVSKINVMKQNKFYKSVEMITLGNLPQILNDNNGSLPIRLPGISKTYLVKENKFIYESDLNYEWIGKLNGRDVGEIIIICKEGKISGQVFINDKEFVIQSFNKETSMLIEYNEKEMTNRSFKCGTKEPKIAPNSYNNVITPNMSRAQNIVKVAVFYTSAATSAGDMNSIATLAVSQMNQAFNNSGITNTVMELRTAPIPYNFTETGNINNDLNTFKSDPYIQASRNNLAADVVVLLTGNAYAEYGAAATLILENANSYALVQSLHATSSRYTFAHEIGHIFGCRHNNDPTDEPWVKYNHGYVFKTGSLFNKKTRYTLMANTALGDYQKILNYSNPDVFYLGVRTGTSDFYNNAKRILYTSGTVSCFRDCNAIYVGISGPVKGYNNGTYTWSANVTGGTAPYTYNWEYTLDGQNYSPFGNTSSITAQLPNNYDLNLRLTVTSSTGHFGSATKTTINLGDNPHGLGASIQSDLNNDLKKSDFDNKLSADRSFIIYPNPNNGTFTLNFQQNSAESYIYVTDIYGKVVFEKQHNTDINVNVILSNTSKGIYVVRVISKNGSTKVKKVVVQ